MSERANSIQIQKYAIFLSLILTTENYERILWQPNSKFVILIQLKN